MKTYSLLMLLCITSLDLSAQCDEPTKTLDIEINNISTQLRNSGSAFGPFLFYKLNSNNPAEEPKSLLGSTSIYMMGFDEAGEMIMFDGNYWGSRNQAGPLDENNETTPETCANWDRFWEADSEDIIDFTSDWSDGTLDVPVPISILSWPGKGNPNFVTLNGFEMPTVDQDYAPFQDVNGDGIYNPYDGDFPAIKGAEKAYYQVYNQRQLGGGGNNPAKMEFHSLVYAYQSNDPVLNSSTYFDLRVINKSEGNIHGLIMSLFINPRIGCSQDDLFGCDSTNQMTYVYNEGGLDGDEDCVCAGGVVSPTYFCDKNPMVGIKILKGATAGRNFDVDGNLIVPDPGTEPDTIIDAGLSSFTYFNNGGEEPPPPPGTVDPDLFFQMYNYMTNKWYDGTPFTVGGIGYDTTSTDYTNYAFSGNPSDEDEWSMCTEEMDTRDRTMLMNSGPFELAPYQTNSFSYAFLHVPDVPEPCPNLDLLNEAANTIEDLYDGIISDIEALKTVDTKVMVSPNPMKSKTTFNLNKSSDLIESIALYSVSGQLISHYENISNNTFTIQKGNLRPGIYFYKLRTKDGMLISGKLVVN